MFISDYTLRAPIRDNEVPTVVNVPLGKSRMMFLSSCHIYARKGMSNAELPDSSAVNDGSAAFPFPANTIYTVDVVEGDRYSFISNFELGTIHVSFV